MFDAISLLFYHCTLIHGRDCLTEGWLEGNAGDGASQAESCYQVDAALQHILHGCACDGACMRLCTACD